MESIQIFTCGGTIDKDYSAALDGYNFVINDSAIQEVLSHMNLAFTFEYKMLLQKDSLDMTDADRELIREECAKCRHNKILITHGTDTMVQTAATLAQIIGKTIVLTGSMRPLAFAQTDAIFNLGTAIGALDQCGPGVWIAFSGKIYHWDQCQKNRRTEKFEPKT
jgi:L-asparaginase